MVGALGIDDCVADVLAEGPSTHQVVRNGLHRVYEPQVAGDRGLAGLQDHALLVDLRPPLLVAGVYSDLPLRYLGILRLQGLNHRVQAALDLPAELHDLLDQQVQLPLKSLSWHATLLYPKRPVT